MSSAPDRSKIMLVLSDRAPISSRDGTSHLTSTTRDRLGAYQHPKLSLPFYG